MAGKSRLPYKHKGNLEDSLLDTEDTELACDDDSDGLSNVCKKCYPVLSHYKQTFQGLVQQGSELKKRKRKKPFTKRDDAEI